MYQIKKITSNTTVDFAAEELKKYLRMMMPRGGEIPVSYDPKAKDGFRLGLMADFGLDTSEAEDLTLDDILHIDTDENGGIIAGSNPRSVLLAVYKYLKLNGCRWLFPGVDGEYIPMQNIVPAKYHKMADLRYRGQCNEGSTAQENYLEAIDFMPKIGMNRYRLEFDIPFAYYDHWYSHKHNPEIAPEPIPPEQVLQWKRQCECEIQKRGFAFHDMGHGWTCEPFGFPRHIKCDDPLPPERVKYFAELNGVRGLLKGNPHNTQVCMSNPIARKIMVDYIADYIKTQNNVDILHLSLGDAGNNHCECSECVKKDTSDWYVIFLNEIDEELTRRNYTTRIAFVLYNDTFWPPMVEKIKNPKRFSLMFAPISRSYTEDYSVDADMSQYVPYERNKLTFPLGMANCLGYLNRWRESYAGDSFCFEYHFWRPHAFNPSYQYIARSIYRDVHGLKKHGLGGIIEDSTPRNYMPSGLAQTVCGEAQFDLSLSFEEIEEDYMSHAFGENWRRVKDFLDSITDEKVYSLLINPPIKPDTGKKDYGPNPYVVETAKGWIEKCEAFKPFVLEHQNHPKRPQTVLWRNLVFFLELVTLQSEFLILKYEGKQDECFDKMKELVHTLGKKELSVQRFFDQRIWVYSYQPFFNPGNMFDIDTQ